MRGAKSDAIGLFDRGGGKSVPPDWRLLSAGIAALVFGFAIVQAATSDFWLPQATQPEDFDATASLGQRIAGGHSSRLASADTEAGFTSLDSFDERFASAFPRRGALTIVYPVSSDRDGSLVAGRSFAASPSVGPAKRKLRVAEAAEDSGLLPEIDERTAIYDIAAHTVYLPNGQNLEAHSGLGGRLDNPRYVSEKDRGPTPPNVYELSLRGELFHGVRAIRLNPVGPGHMFGRDGILAHTFMLGPNGQSNGCVSFRDYPAFLNAFLSGEVTRMVVVEHLATAPNSKTASGRLPDAIKAVFRHS